LAESNYWESEDEQNIKKINELINEAEKQIENEGETLAPQGYDRSSQLKILKQRINIPCINLGDPLDDLESCNCVKTAKYRCKLHKECRKMGGTIGQVKVCTSCEDYIPK